jgi:hypothetical protein
MIDRLFPAKPFAETRRTGSAVDIVYFPVAVEGDRSRIGVARGERAQIKDCGCYVFIDWAMAAIPDGARRGHGPP